MNIKKILTISGKLENQSQLCMAICHKLGEKEFIFGFSLDDLKHNKKELQKYMVKPKIWERLIPGYYHSYKVKKEQLGDFCSLLIPFPNSFGIFVNEEGIYWSHNACDIYLSPRTPKETDQFIALLNDFKKDKIIDGFILEEDDDYEDPYYSLK